MLEFLIGQISFWVTTSQVNPTKIVDTVIRYWLDMTIPGGGVGESSWWMNGIRSLQQSERRISREMDLRNQLRQWDNEYPQIHHELLVRYLCGAIVSVVCTNLYHEIVKGGREWARGGSRR